ncbi:MAG: hypothetical protein PHR47_02525 [Candidatus Pacebacteria bacterium]|nr:hypothetical protein [Candidatus Paceibacterota bacterium]
MSTFYYRDPVSKFCPVKQYLKKFSNENKLLVTIDGKIKSVAIDGHPFLPIAKMLIGYSTFEIIQPFKDINIRLLCAFVSDELILFHAFDKPRYYDNVKKVKRDIEKNYNISEKYYNIFLDGISKKNYEEYKEEYK